MRALITALALLAGPANMPPDWRDGGWLETLPAGATALLPAGRYLGPWTLRGKLTIRAAGAQLELGDRQDGGVALTIEGDVRIDGLTVVAPSGGTAVRVQPGARAELRDVRLAGPGSARLYAARAGVKLSGARLEGGEYGVMSQAAELEIDGCHFTGQSRDGVAAVNGVASITGSDFTGPFGEAAIELVHVDHGQLAQDRVTSAGAIGIKILNSHATLTSDRISGSRTDARGLEGNALYADGSVLALTGVALSDSEGPALALIHARAHADGFTIDGAKEAAVYLERGSALTGRGIVIRHAPSGIVAEVDTVFPDGGVRFEDVAQPIVRLPP